MTPLQSILQFRPSFEFLNAADDAKKKAQQDEKQEEATAEGEGEEEDTDRKSTPIGVCTAHNIGRPYSSHLLSF